MNKTILVLNMGMKSIRSIIFDSTGAKIASAALPIQTSLSGGCVTQNPEEWLEKANSVIKESLSQVKDIHIDFITVTSSASCLICVDKDLKPLLPCMMVSDKRAVKESEEIENMQEFKAVYKDTSLAMDCSLLLPKALWVKNNMKDVWARTYKLLTPNDFFIAHLTGVYAIDYINAQKWHYCVKNKCYPLSLLNTLNIPSSFLPSVMSPGSKIANIKEDVALRLGINANAQIILSSYDAICSFIGSGVNKEGEASDVSGTVTVFRALTKQNNLCESRKIQSIPFGELGINIVGGSNNLGGGLIEWVKQCYYLNEALPYELMEKEARETSLGSGGVIFLPYLLGERVPLWDSNARGVFFGLERAHTRREMTRAVFESAGFIDLDMMAAIEETGVKVKSIKLSGGLARVNLVSQIKADVTGKEIEVLSEFETTATGAAMIAFIGQGVFNSLDEAAFAFVNVRMIIKPNKKSFEQYQQLYKLFKETYKTLKPMFLERSKLVDEMYGQKNIKIENL